VKKEYDFEEADSLQCVQRAVKRPFGLETARAEKCKPREKPLQTVLFISKSGKNSWVPYSAVSIPYVYISFVEFRNAKRSSTPNWSLEKAEVRK
jgi:hypothetical protein